jgi:Tfp pilus assembly protein PilF
MGDPARLDSPPEQLTSALYVRAAAWSEHQGATAKARQQYEKALELEPRNVKTILLLARFHDRQKNDSEASRWYARARELEPNNALVLNDIGLFHARRREFQPALEALEQAVRLTPRNVRYHNNLAGVLVQAGRPNDAVTSLQRVHGDTIANLNVGNFLYMEKDFSRAALYLRRAQQLDPSLVAARDLLSRIDEAVAQVAPATDERTRIVTARSEAGGYSSPYRPVSTPTAGSLETRSWNGTRLPLIADRAPSTTANEGPRRLPVPQ